MADVFSTTKRSLVMARIRGKGNKDTELAMIKLFKRHHIRGWRRNRPLLGKPDFVFPADRVAVFVDGCFWHCCPEHGRKPSTRQDYWLPKLLRNVERDRFVSKSLRDSGWRVLRFWEHDLKNPGIIVSRIQKALNSSSGSQASDSPARNVIRK